MMDTFLVTLSSKHGQSTKVATSTGVHEVLYQWGLEWKTANQFHDHEVIITIRPYDDDMEAQKNQLESRLAEIERIVSGD